MGTVAGTLKDGWAALRAFVARRAPFVVGVVAVLALVSLVAWRWSSLKSAAALQWEQRVSGLAERDHALAPRRMLRPALVHGLEQLRQDAL